MEIRTSTSRRDDAPGSVLRDRGAQPFAPADVARAVLVADDGLYEALVTVHGADALHHAGAWGLLRSDVWDELAAHRAAALRDLLGTVQHPLARPAVAALSEGIALAAVAAIAAQILPSGRDAA